MSIAILDTKEAGNDLGHNDLHINQPPAIAALVADLMFASRVRGAAPGAKTVHRGDALLETVGAGTRLVLVDLHAPGALAAIGEVRERAPGAAVVAFGSHVETAALRAAREAGADRVMARSAFVRELPEIVREAAEGA